MFDIYVNEATGTEEWHTLVHVCRRWRNVVFSSPRRLDLRLLCTGRRPVRARLNVWPALPIIVAGSLDPTGLPVEGADNILAALEHRDRVCQINFQHVPNSVVERLAAAMYEPFQELTHLEHRSNDESCFGPSRFLLGWVRSASTTTSAGLHPISGITEVTSVRVSTRQPPTCRYSTFRVHFTSDHGD
jgi:hypothetical protein